MKKLMFALFILGLFAGACSRNEKATVEIQEPLNPEIEAEPLPHIIEPQLINGQTVGMAEIGMTLENLREKYPEYVFTPRSVFEYGIDGESKGLLALKADVPQFFVWTLDGESTVHGIVILSNEFVTENGLKVGITVEEVLEKYPKMEVQRDGLDPDMEFINIEDKKITLHFINPPGEFVGEYETDNPEETSRSFALDRKVDRIYVN